jgi:hypothetical protein
MLNGEKPPSNSKQARESCGQCCSELGSVTAFCTAIDELSIVLPWICIPSNMLVLPQMVLVLDSSWMNRQGAVSVCVWMYMRIRLTKKEALFTKTNDDCVSSSSYKLVDRAVFTYNRLSDLHKMAKSIKRNNTHSWCRFIGILKKSFPFPPPVVQGHVASHKPIYKRQFQEKQTIFFLPNHRPSSKTMNHADAILAAKEKSILPTWLRAIQPRRFL